MLVSRFLLNLNLNLNFIQFYPTGLIERKLTEDDIWETEYFADTEVSSPASNNGRSDSEENRRNCLKGKGTI